MMMEVDISIQKHAKKGDDILKININNKNEEEHFVEMNYTKFFAQSKYIRNKYDYREGIETIQQEFTEAKETLHVSTASMKIFIDVVELERIELGASDFYDVYKLSERFENDKLKSALDDLNEQFFIQDIDFTIEFFHLSETQDKFVTTDMRNNAERFLSSRVNDCLNNPRFSELSISSIYRIIANSIANIKNIENENVENIESVEIVESFDTSILLDFICEKIEDRVVLLEFIEIENLPEDKIEHLFKFLDSQSSSIRREFENHLHHFTSYMKKQHEHKHKIETELKSTVDTLSMKNHEIESLKRELSENKLELDKMKSYLTETRSELSVNKNDLKKIKEELEHKNNEFDDIRKDLTESKIQIEQSTNEFENIKNELEQTKLELDQVKDELEQIKSEKKQNPQSVLVCGYDKHSAHFETSNNKSINGDPCSYPPMNARFDSSSLLSFSAVCAHSVQVTRGGSLLGAGYNRDDRISNMLAKTAIKHPTEFSISDNNGNNLKPVSAACLRNGTLYMLSKSENSDMQLVLCHEDSWGQVFLDIGNKKPVGLFSGRSHAAAISSDGEVIFINPSAVVKIGGSRIASTPLPGNEKAVSVACLDSTLIALSLSGRVFSSPIKSGSSTVNFLAVSELAEHKIVCISGIKDHCLAVSSEGHVFVYGSNHFGQLGLCKETQEVSHFVEITSFGKYKIRAVYAGYYHSLFETREGKVLSCGNNSSGQLFLSTGPSRNCFYSPEETTVSRGATFCIAGDGFSVIFIGVDPPPYVPNRRIIEFK